MALHLKVVSSPAGQRTPDSLHMQVQVDCRLTLNTIKQRFFFKKTVVEKEVFENTHVRVNKDTESTSRGQHKGISLLDVNSKQSIRLWVVIAKNKVRKVPGSLGSRKREAPPPPPRRYSQ